MLDVTTPPPSRAVFTLRIAGRPGQAGIHALRFLLKRLLRQYGFTCLDAREEVEPAHIPSPSFAATAAKAPRHALPHPDQE